VARNLLRQQFGQATRQQRLADHISALTTEADLLTWDAGEHAVERAAALDALGALPGDDVETLTLVTHPKGKIAMNLREDSLKVVADLQSASLDRLAEEGYARRRAGDLGRLLSEPSGQARRDRHLTVVRVPRGRVLAAAGAGLAAAAVATAVILVPSAPGHPAAGPGAQGKQGRPAAGLPAILLTAAHVAAGRQAATGLYWYVKERDFEPTATHTKTLFGASYGATQETWTGATRIRTIVNEKLVFSFATAADKARWQAAGEPQLSNPAGFGRTGPVTSNYDFGGYSYNIGAIKVSLASARKLPTTLTTYPVHSGGHRHRGPWRYRGLSRDGLDEADRCSARLIGPWA
jgi:hypothetical protein